MRITGHCLSTGRVHSGAAAQQTTATGETWPSHRDRVRGVCRLQQCRSKFYELLTNCIPPEVSLLTPHQITGGAAQQNTDIANSNSKKLLHLNLSRAQVILKELAMTLLGKVDNALVQSVSQWAAHYEHRIRLGQKPIFRASSSPLSQHSL